MAPRRYGERNIKDTSAADDDEKEKEDEEVEKGGRAYIMI